MRQPLQEGADMLFEKKVLSIYREKLLKRRDLHDRPFRFYKQEFLGLESLDLSFKGNGGQTLFAHFYFRGNRRSDKLIIFDHGMGSGHTDYLKEIDVITKRGYTVFTYDHTGTGLSGGDDIGGFSQSLSDLDMAISFVRSLPEYRESEISVIGHSWGGYSTMNIVALYPDITHAVAISGFISPKAIQSQALGIPLAIYRPLLFKLERERLPDYCGYDGRESLIKSEVKALILHSRDDGICYFKKHFEKLRKAMGNKENVEFLATDRKGHYPHYTEEAVAYKKEFNTEYKKMLKRGVGLNSEEMQAFIKSYDFHKMHEQDEGVWNKILEFIEK
jgi:pimeloyl-ACP methyl ester carboxylesterase